MPLAGTAAARLGAVENRSVQRGRSNTLAALELSSGDEQDDPYIAFRAVSFPLSMVEQRHRGSPVRGHARGVTSASMVPAQSWALSTRPLRRAATAPIVGREVSLGVDRYRTYGLPHQLQVRQCYTSVLMQKGVAFVILLNFAFDAYHAHLTMQDLIDRGILYTEWVEELLFALFFTGELCVNLYAHFWWVFWRSPWSIFDCIVVTTSWVTLGSPTDASRRHDVARFVRAMRIFRIVQRVKGLRVILRSVRKALPGLLNVTVLAALATFVWSIMAVEFFRDEADKKFQDFGMAALTFCELATFSNWITAITKPYTLKHGPGSALFFISYVLLCGVLFINVLVALLVENFASALKEAQALAKSRRRPPRFLDRQASRLRNSMVARFPVASSAILGMHQAPRHGLAAAQLPDSAKRPLAAAPGALEAAAAAVDDATGPLPAPPVRRGLLPGQWAVRRCYDADATQKVVALFIVLNFLTAAVRAQVPPKSEWLDLILSTDITFTILFTAEVSVNLYAHFFAEFFSSPWNVLDLVVVVVSCFAFLTDDHGQGKYYTLRLLRAGFILRIVKRLEGMKVILESITMALPGILHAMLLLVMIMSAWSLMAVDLFSRSHPDWFAHFGMAMLTFLSMCTFDGWGDVVRRMTMDHSIWAGLFFLLYTYISGIVVLNIVIAIFVERFAGAMQRNRKPKRTRASFAGDGGLAPGGGVSACAAGSRGDMEMAERPSESRGRERPRGEVAAAAAGEARAAGAGSAAVAASAPSLAALRTQLASLEPAGMGGDDAKAFLAALKRASG